MSQPEVLIVSEGDWYAVCRLPHLLHRAGVKATLLALPRGLARRTRFAEKLPVKGYDVGHLVAILRAHLAAHPSKYAMVIPGDDMIMRALAAEPEAEWLRPWFPVDPTPEKLNLILSKAAMVQACTANGLPSPHSIVCRHMNDALAAAASIGYPVFFKGEESSGGFGVGRAENADELRRVAATLPAHFTRIFSIQAAVEGRVGSTAVLAWRGEAIQWIGSYKEATWPEPYGASTQREFMHHPDIELMARRVARLTGFSGFFGIDWMQDATTGRCQILEVNARPTPQIMLGACCGVDFSDGLRHLLAGGPPPPATPTKMPTGKYRLFPQDLFRCSDRNDLLGAGVSLLEIVRGRTDFPWQDYSVAVGMLKKLARHRRNQRGLTVEPRSPAR